MSEKRLDTHAKKQYNYTILKISWKISCIKSEAVPILHLPWYLFSQWEMTQKSPTNPHRTGFTAEIKKLPKSKKRYHLVSFRRKNPVFGIFQDTR